MAGKFIVFEGVDGCGKTTQLQRYRNYLQDWITRPKHYAQLQRYRNYLRGEQSYGNATASNGGISTTAEPYGPAGQFIRHVLSGGAPLFNGPVAMAQLFAASRIEHADNVIRPALAEGAILLCDRYLPSSLAFQGQGFEPGDAWIEQINAWNEGIPIPDLTIVFTISPEMAAARIAARGGKQDRFDASAIGEIAQRCAIYARIEEYGEVGPVARIDAEAPLDEVQSQVRALLDPLIFGKGDQDGVSMRDPA